MEKKTWDTPSATLTYWNKLFTKAYSMQKKKKRKKWRSWVTNSDACAQNDASADHGQLSVCSYPGHLLRSSSMPSTELLLPQNCVSPRKPTTVYTHTSTLIFKTYNSKHTLNQAYHSGLLATYPLFCLSPVWCFYFM